MSKQTDVKVWAEAERLARGVLDSQDYRLRVVAGESYEGHPIAIHYFAKALVDALLAFRARARKEALEEAAGVAAGHSGPGNTLENCAGYTAACNEIKATLRALAAEGAGEGKA